MGMKVMVIGSGGREHAISWKLAQSSKVDEIICVPGNGGTFNETKCRNIEPSECDYTTDVKGIDSYVQIAVYEQVDFVIVGPEDPLSEGIADQLWKCGIPTVGPKSAGASLEASKDVAKQFMQQHNVACAFSKTVTDIEEAHGYIEEKGAPIVVKADGLAAGKGVVVAATKEDAHKAIDDFMANKTLGDAGAKVVLEEYLQGVEISVLAAVSVTKESASSGKATILPFTTARDHKRLLDGAKGPNTGGMGAIAPVQDVSPEQWNQFMETCLNPTLQGMIAEKMDYRGFIFFGVMLTKEGPKLLEYNVRLGDPETQAVLPLMDFDFADLCVAILDLDNNGSLADFTCSWKKGFICAPVVVSSGYPAAYKKGYPISLDTNIINKNGATIFIAGGIQKDSNLVTSGGRVLACSAYGDTFEEAWKNSYGALEGVHFTDLFYRKDIGLPGAAESGSL